jgi:hypothetical protein
MDIVETLTHALFTGVTEGACSTALKGVWEHIKTKYNHENINISTCVNNKEKSSEIATKIIELGGDKDAILSALLSNLDFVANSFSNTINNSARGVVLSGVSIAPSNEVIINTGDTHHHAPNFLNKLEKHISSGSSKNSRTRLIEELKGRRILNFAFFSVVAIADIIINNIRDAGFIIVLTAVLFTAISVISLLKSLLPRDFVDGVVINRDSSTLLKNEGKERKAKQNTQLPFRKLTVQELP